MPLDLPDHLTRRQQSFIEEYVRNWNATAAAIRAGYKPRTAAQQGSRLLRNAKVAAAIARHTSQATRRADLDLQKMVEHWSAIAFSTVCLADYFSPSVNGVTQLTPLSQWTPQMKMMAAKVNQSKHGLSVELRDRDHAMDMLSKYVTTGGFSDRVMLAGDKGSPLPVQQAAARDPELDLYTREVLKEAQALVADKRRRLERTSH